MASSHSIGKGQTALVCQLCENDPKIKWKCMDCGLLMCQRCRDKVHPKFPLAKDHIIIDIKDIHQHQSEPKLDFTQLKCGVHTGHMSYLYCNTCDELVCPLCIAKTHKKQHDLIEISEGYQIRAEKIRNGQKNIDQKIQLQIKGEEDFGKIKLQEHTKFEKTRKEILDFEKALSAAVNAHVYKLLSELDQQWRDMSKFIEEETNKVKKNQKTLLEQNDKINYIVQSCDPKDILCVSDTFLKSLETDIKPINNIFPQVPKFVLGDISKFPSLHGNLVKATPLNYQTKLEVVKQFTTDIGGVNNILNCRDGSLWINDGDNRQLQKVNPVGETLHVISIIKVTVHNMALTSSEDLLLATGTSTIQVIPSGILELMDSLYDVSPLLPTAVHVTHDNKVIVGAVDKVPCFPVTGPRQVKIMDHTGKEKKFFQFDGNKKPLFSLPIRIASNSRNNIGVIDCLSMNLQGRIIVLDQEGGVKNIYTGHPDVNHGNKLFCPTGIVTTPSDKFVVADLYVHIIHILSSDGGILTYHKTGKVGVELPYSLSISHTGQLYTGCSNYTSSKEKAKIHVIDNFGW